ncbi:MAG: site-specific integrase [Dokdonella sp.]
MPKPLLLRRPSGLYVRFLLPAAVFRRLNVRFLVRSLRGLRGDAARLTAARMGYALAQTIAGAGERMDKKLLDDTLARVARGEFKRYELTSGPGGVPLKADGPEDHARALDALERIGVLKDMELLPRFRTPPPLVVPSGPMLHASIATFLEQFKKKKRARSTVEETEHSLALFRDLVDDVPMADFGNDQTDAFSAALAHWPPRARVMPKYRDLPNARAIVEKSRAAGDGDLSERTVDKHLDRLSVFINWAMKRRKLTFNPLAGERNQTAAQKYAPVRRSFNSEELALVFDPYRRMQYCVDDPAFFWLPVLGVYMGARQGELAQLLVADLGQVNEVWGIHITAEGETAKGVKRLKNAQSKRFVPLPVLVLDLRFLDYAQDVRAAGFKELFPGGAWGARNGPGTKVSKWFNRSYLRKVCGLTAPDLVFHSLRHTWETQADRLGFSESQAGRITGHTGRSVQSRFYIDALTVAERKALQERIAAALDVPRLAPYHPDQFAEFFRTLPMVEKRAAAAVAKRKATVARKKAAGAPLARAGRREPPP